jgi:hypothetical protein
MRGITAVFWKRESAMKIVLVLMLSAIAIILPVKAAHARMPATSEAG